MIIPHNMHEGHAVSRLYLYSPRIGNPFSERAVVLQPNGLARVLDDVGRGYARAAADVGNFGSVDAAATPWTAAYQVPQDFGLFELDGGWSALDFVVFPVGCLPGTGPGNLWQLMSLAEKGVGWRSGGLLKFSARGGALFLPPSETGPDHAIDLQGLRSADLMNMSAWRPLQEHLQGAADEVEPLREKMGGY